MAWSISRSTLKHLSVSCKACTNNSFQPFLFWMPVLYSSPRKCRLCVWLPSCKQVGDRGASTWQVVLILVARWVCCDESPFAGEIRQRGSKWRSAVSASTYIRAPTADTDEGVERFAAAACVTAHKNALLAQSCLQISRVHSLHVRQNEVGLHPARLRVGVYVVGAPEGEHQVKYV